MNLDLGFDGALCLETQMSYSVVKAQPHHVTNSSGP